jgi:hypothetical protein
MTRSLIVVGVLGLATSAFARGPDSKVWSIPTERWRPADYQPVVDRDGNQNIAKNVAPQDRRDYYPTDRNQPPRAPEAVPASAIVGPAASF